ncbi:OmpA family protein [Pseudoflavitalea sp. G-6-1-2]|uniref:OmpA family protein n=1 Tax=Pseudoflavitalea sp. G-6-1-2 TaxID=2728841 RepID=UPI00146CF17C|nr:OmpA family protein [Pseudoflavitalea sp. G-6-1-2]NML22698.1 OmpA family protein [Pseudoflavitalea sp. G-6-1-2]
MGFKQFCTIIIASLATCLHSYAQYDPDKVNKKVVAIYDEALSIAHTGNYPKALTQLEGAVAKAPGFLDAWLSIAGIHGEMKHYKEAIAAYEKAKSIDNNYFRDYNLPYSINLAGQGDFQKAVAAVDDFLGIPNLNEKSKMVAQFRKKSYQFAIDYAQQKPLGAYRFEPSNLGDSINSKDSEYYPTITIDGKELIFTRRINGINEDFFGASRNSNGWHKANPLNGNINTQSNEGAQNISQDGQWLIFTGCNFPGGAGSCDLYISYLTSNGWSEPESLGPRINTEAWESAPSLSPDKKELYFASNRAGGFGGSDLYVSRLLPNGRWGEPENLGAEINTPGEESCPFIHADNQTLYFTSNGHLGYGGDDLFISKKQPKGGWSKAVNLGYPINTIENEGSLVVSADGKTAWYASDRSDSKGGLDIYTFELRSDIRPARTLWVKGKVYDIKTQKGLPSSVELTDLASQEVLSKVQTDETGHYLVTLPVGKDYAFNVNRKGYLFYSENFSLSNNTDSVFNIDIPLQPLEANATMVLRNVFFDVNRYDLKPESTSELDKLVVLLRDNPTIRIQLSGHTDNVGKAEDNLVLSNNRAQAVVKYLVAHGIEQQRLAFKGYGATQPVAENTTEEGRAKNRRTELKVISQ